MRPTPKAQNPEPRRRFERVDIAHQAQVLVLDAKGRKTGVLRQLARGGFMMEPEKHYGEDSKIYTFTIHEPTEDIRVRVNARLRGVAEADLKIGQRVTLAFEPVTKEITLPFFTT